MHSRRNSLKAMVIITCWARSMTSDRSRIRARPVQLTSR